MNDKITDDTMTPHEYVRLVGFRAYQLRMGSKPVIDWPFAFNPIAIAKSELKQRVLPIAIIRKIPDCNSETGFRDEIWNPNDMNIRDF